MEPRGRVKDWLEGKPTPRDAVDGRPTRDKNGYPKQGCCDTRTEHTIRQSFVERFESSTALNITLASKEQEDRMNYSSKDKVCMILDLEGFFVENTFRCRELGYFTWQEDFGRHAFFMKTSWNDLHFKDRKTVSYVKYNVHGLTYQPRREEHGHEYYLLEDVMCDLYNNVKTKDRTVVAYKGGHVEQDLLVKLNIPHVNLEHYGCIRNSSLRLFTDRGRIEKDVDNATTNFGLLRSFYTYRCYMMIKVSRKFQQYQGSAAIARTLFY
ncbi:hypothetical protein ACROYT_G016530 [Oculina patagonica]